jgi:ATP:ADP antiporter, AAA family
MPGQTIDRPLGFQERILGIFTKIEAGEAGTALLLMLNLFLLLTSYYILKTVREPLILMGGGAALKSYTAAGQAILLLGVIPLYSALVNRIPRLKLINRVILFFISNLILFYVLARAGVPYLGVAFYLWVGIFSLMIIAQAWSFANDIYTREQGKRLFPLIAFGSSLGAIAGSVIAGRLFALGIGSFEMMLMAAVLLLGCLGLTQWVGKREAGQVGDDHPVQTGEAVEEESAAAGDKTSGFMMVLRDNYLLLIAMLMLLTNIVNTTGEFILGSKVTAAAALAANEESFIGGFYSTFFSYVNAISAFLQLFLVSRIIKLAGVRRALFVLPVIALGGYALMAFSSALAMIRVAKIFENSTDYSLQNTVRQALFLPTSRAAKYKAKQAIDTFFVRAGDVASAGVVFLGTSLGFATRHFALLNIGLVLIWLVLVVGIGRQHRKMTSE